MIKNKELKELHNEFISDCEHLSKLSEVTIRGYRASFNLFMDIMPGTELEDLSVDTMRSFFEKLDTRKRIVGKNKVVTGVKNSTAATYWSKLNVFTQWLEDDELIKKNPFSHRKIRKPTVRYEDKKFLSKIELEKIFSAVTFGMDWQNSLVRKRNLAILTVGFHCGLRRGELLGLRLMDVDLGRKQLTVKAETSKSRANRVVPFSKKVTQCLQDYISERRKRGYRNQVLFVSGNADQAFTRHGLKHLIKKINRESGVKFHIHQLRHSFAVNLIANGCDLSRLQQLMGHTDIRMTVLYLRCIPSESMREDTDRISIDSMP
jgi:integrase/recombinase XerD